MEELKHERNRAIDEVYAYRKEIQHVKMWLQIWKVPNNIYNTKLHVMSQEIFNADIIIYDGFEEIKQIQEIQIYKMKRTWAREQIDLHRVDVKWNEERK